MTRTGFLKSLIAIIGVSAIPLKPAKKYKKIYLLQDFIRGFQFHQGQQLLGEIKQGSPLQLVREPNNEHDPMAIAVHFKKEKIGYIAREKNKMLSKMIDADILPVQAEATFVNPAAAAWEKLHIAVFMLKETDEELHKKSSYLSLLKRPRYRSMETFI